MASPAEQPSLILIQRLADGRVDWIPLGPSPKQIPASHEAAYTVIDRANYEAPQTLIAQRVGEDLVVQVQGNQVLVLDRFFTTAGVAFYPTTDIASGAGPFSGAALTADSAASATGEQVVWSAGATEKTAANDDESSGEVSSNSPMLWVGLAAGGVGLLALGAGGGGGGESGGGATIQGGPVPDTVAPSITSGAIAPAIAENSGAGQVVYTITATDAGTITYSLKAGDDAAAFNVNNSTGAVTLTGNPDFEAKSSYHFTVVATDGVGNSTERAISLAINDVNDSPPPTITSGATARAINENSGAQQLVYTVTATGTGAITYGLKPGGDAASFSINTNTGAVTLTANPDDEAKPSYQFTVVATDAAHNSSERAVSLNIIDLDEVAPTITSGATAPAISENSGSNQIVYTVTSTDTEDISTGNTTYSLKAGGDADAFSINAGTGAVRLTANPDFEAKSSYHFTVVATDAAGNGAERAVSLAILNVVDLDEVAPTITSGATATAINENSGPNQIVYTVTSTDNEDINDRNTTYSLRPGEDADAFSINASTGVVRLIANPDFEAKSNYHFTVVATDAAHNSSAQPVSLAINDIADTVDVTPPAVDHVALTGAVGRENGILDAGDTVSVTVTMTENTQVNTSGGTPSIELRIGNDKVDAGYVSGSGTTSLIFEYTIQRGDADKDGISIASNALDRNGGSITDLAGNAADLKNESVGSNPLFVVDTKEPHSFSLGDGSTLNVDTGEFTVGLAASADSSRTFQSSAGEDIDIRVAGNDATSSTVAGASEWSGSANLGSDDRVVVVMGNGADSRDPSAQMTIADAAVAEQSLAGSDAGLLQDISVAHSTPFDGGAVQPSFISLIDVPIGITSQGVG